MMKVGVEGMLKEESGTARRKKDRKKLGELRQRVFCNKLWNHYKEKGE